MTLISSCFRAKIEETGNLPCLNVTYKVILTLLSVILVFPLGR